jgi:hypothetical protein
MTDDARTDSVDLSPGDLRANVEAHGGRADFVWEGPPVFPQCHAATLVETRGDALLCAWFGGTQEGHGDVAIWLARFGDGAWAGPVKNTSIALASGAWLPSASKSGRYPRAYCGNERDRKA